MSENKVKNTKNNKKSDGKFASKSVNHNPREESSRTKNGLTLPNSDSDRKAHGS